MAEAKRDYYEVLGVQKGATEDEIKKAYRKTAKNIILIFILTIRKLRKNLKSATRHMRCFQTLRKRRATISLDLQA